MSDVWKSRRVPINLMLSDRILLAPALQLQVRQVGLDSGVAPVADPGIPEDKLERGNEGFLIRSMPLLEELPMLKRTGTFIRYAPSQFRRHYIDLSQSFAEYQQKFSSKTRSTIRRKIKKYAEHAGGEIRWKAYSSPEEMPEFFHLAREVSALTYQERLLDAGLPDSEEFRASTIALAARGDVRAFILFDAQKPVAYLFCPVQGGILIYQYLGYHPEYAKWSVGTILQWLALEKIFDERRFRIFDFTEGESEHKRFFGTHSLLCANVFFIRRTPRNLALIRAQIACSAVSKKVGDFLERHGAKAKIRRLLRGTG